MAQVIDADVEDDPDGEPQIRQGVARDRIVSHSDLEMRHGRKWLQPPLRRPQDGRHPDEDSELILGVDIRAGIGGDGEGAAPLVGQVQQTPGIEIDTMLGDMAYSDGDVRRAVEDRGVRLVAKVPPLTNGGYYLKTDFDIDLPRGEVTCPAGEVTADARPTTDHKGRWH